MCYPHVHAKVEHRIKTLKKESDNEELAKKVLHDIETYQWIVSKKSYEIDYNSLENKYLNEDKYKQKEREALADFFAYFREQWGPNSKCKYWFEHAFPFHIGHNMGIEGTNKDIKKNHTFKQRVGLGKLFDILARMLREWSERDDSILFGSRLAPLFQKDIKDGQGMTGLARQTAGWKFSHEYRKGVPNKVVRIPNTVENYSTISEYHGLGTVTQLYGINTKKSSSELLLKIRAKLAERANPSNKSWEEKKKILIGCHLIEERDGDFYCDCFEGIKGRLCEHTTGMHFRNKTGKIPVTEDVRSLPIAQKRPKGRPKQLPANALTRSPPKARQEPAPLMNVSTEDLEAAVGGSAPTPAPLYMAMSCSLCQEDGLVTVAVVYCKECSDHLCEECRRAHAKTRVTKTHNVTEPVLPADEVIHDLPIIEQPSEPLPTAQQAVPPGPEAPEVSQPPPSQPPLAPAETPLAPAHTSLAPPEIPLAPAQTSLAPVQTLLSTPPGPSRAPKSALHEICKFCGTSVSKKSIRAHERSLKCANQRAGGLSTSTPVKRLLETSLKNPRGGKRQNLSPTASSSPPVKRGRRGVGRRMGI